MCLDLINKLINNGNGKSLIAEMVKDFSVEAWNGKARKMRDLEDLQTLDINIKTVSYTHLTLPTKRIV